LQLLRDLSDFKVINPAISEAALNSFRNHTIYLDEVHIALAFFDLDVPIEIKKKMQANLKNQFPSVLIDRTNFWSLDFNKIQLYDLVSERTIDFFTICGLNHSFLQQPVEQWTKNPFYRTALKCAEDLTVTNEVAERGCQLATTYNGRLYKDQDKLNDLVITAATDRKDKPSATKSAYKIM